MLLRSRVQLSEQDDPLAEIGRILDLRGMIAVLAHEPSGHVMREFSLPAVSILGLVLVSHHGLDCSYLWLSSLSN